MVSHLSKVTQLGGGRVLGFTVLLPSVNYTESHLPSRAIWSTQHPRSPPLEVSFHLHTASKGVNSDMTSCQDGKGRGTGDRSDMGHRALGASCCALPREQPARSSEKQTAEGTARATLGRQQLGRFHLQ